MPKKLPGPRRIRQNSSQNKSFNSYRCCIRGRGIALVAEHQEGTWQQRVLAKILKHSLRI